MNTYIIQAIGMLEKEDWSGNLHALRHTFASMLFANNTPVKAVSEILGHADTKVTENIYIYLIKRQKIKAIKDIDSGCY